MRITFETTHYTVRFNEEADDSFSFEFHNLVSNLHARHSFTAEQLPGIYALLDGIRAQFTDYYEHTCVVPTTYIPVV